MWDSNRFNAARMSAVGDGLTEPLIDFIEFYIVRKGEQSKLFLLLCMMKIPQYTKYSKIFETLAEENSSAQIIKKEFPAVAMN